MSDLINLDDIDILHERKMKGDIEYLLIKFDGKLITDNVSNLTEELENIFEDEIIDTLLDLSNLRYVNSTGLSLLLTLWKKVINNNKKIIFFDLHPFMDELLKMTELNSKFLIKNDFETALDCLS